MQQSSKMFLLGRPCPLGTEEQHWSLQRRNHLPNTADAKTFLHLFLQKGGGDSSRYISIVQTVNPKDWVKSGMGAVHDGSWWARTLQLLTLVQEGRAVGGALYGGSLCTAPRRQLQQLGRGSGSLDGQNCGGWKTAESWDVKPWWQNSWLLNGDRIFTVRIR